MVPENPFSSVKVLGEFVPATVCYYSSVF